MREPDERPEDFLAPLTAPDFFVEDVRLEAAAARLVVAFPEVRPFEAELLAAPLAAPRLEERAEDFAAERPPVERDAPDLALEREAVFEPPRAAVEREVDVFLAVDLVDFAEDFAADEREVDFAAVFFALDFAAVFLAPDFAADFFAPDLAEDLAAVDLDAVRPEDLAAVLVDREVDFAAVFVPAFFEAVLFEPVFDALFAAPERDEVLDDFAALLRAVEPVLFLAPDFELLEEPRRELLFLDLVLVAPVSPVNSIVSGFDLSSVGIAASFKGLRVQPSRLQGNVVIPRRFRLTESVGSRTRTISVDIFCERPAWTYGFDRQ
ncbi:hypothetical protein [Microvirga aerophila]|uniref:Uncharacterized protein n=1 Tax=Microvirga aerophila TaxID=670291 RepID=A0A512BPG9_9HYPH|nr:hypothetical protein [Microvirga aerophila]GEO13858.1 hypothetical protein MAE02_15540 [Microvirga aerophila]